MGVSLFDNAVDPNNVQGPLLPGQEQHDIFPDPEEPSFTELLGAGMLEQNFVASGLDSTQFGFERRAGLPEDPDFDPRDYIPEHLKEASQIEAFVLHARNPEQALEVQRKLEHELEVTNALNNGGGLGLLARFAGSLTQPTTLLPIVPAKMLANFGRMGIFKRVATAGTFTAGGIALEEAILHESQFTRTAQESEIALAGGFIMGGAFGWLIGRASSKVLATAEMEARQLMAGRGATKRIDISTIRPLDQSTNFRIPNTVEFGAKMDAKMIAEQIEAQSKALVKIEEQSKALVKVEAKATAKELGQLEKQLAKITEDLTDMHGRQRLEGTTKRVSDVLRVSGKPNRSLSETLQKGISDLTVRQQRISARIAEIRKGKESGLTGSLKQLTADLVAAKGDFGKPIQADIKTGLPRGIPRAVTDAQLNKFKKAELAGIDVRLGGKGTGSKKDIVNSILRSQGEIIDERGLRHAEELMNKEITQQRHIAKIDPKTFRAKFDRMDCP